MNMPDFWKSVAEAGSLPTTETPVSASTNIADFWKKVAEGGSLPVTSTPLGASANLPDFWMKVAAAGVVPTTSTLVEFSNQEDYWAYVAANGVMPISVGNVYANAQDLWRAISAGTSGASAANLATYLPAQSNFRAVFPFDDLTPSYARLINPVVALGRDTVVNGDFVADADWTKGTGWTIAGGKLVATAASSTTAYQSQTLTAGATYTLTYTIDGYSGSGSCTAIVGNGSTVLQTAPGTYSVDIAAAASPTPRLTFSASATAYTANLSNISLKRKDIPASSAYAYAEKLVNGNMELETGWAAGNNATLTYESTNPQAGAKCLRVAYNGTSTPAAVQTVLTVGKRYWITGYYHGDGTFAPRVNNGTGYSLVQGTSSTSWQAFSLGFIAVDTTILLRALATGAGYAEFDSVSIIDIDPGGGMVTGATQNQTATGSKQLTGYAFTGNNDNVNMYSQLLNDIVDPNLFTFGVFIKADAVSAWWDVTVHYLFNLRGLSVNNYLVGHTDGVGGIIITLARGGTLETVRVSVNGADLFCLHMVVDKANDDFIVLVNGSQYGVTRTALGARKDNLYDAGTVVGNQYNYTTNGFSGFMSSPFFFNEARSAANCLADAQAGGAVIAAIGEPCDATADFVACDGDSLTIGTGGIETRPYPSQLCELLDNYEIYNGGGGGQKSADLLLDVVATIDSKFEAARTRNIYVLRIGINDVLFDVATATTIANIWTLCDDRRTAGFDVIVCNLTPTAGLSAPRLAAWETINAAIAADWADHADGYVDLAGDARLDDPTDTTYYQSDTLHFKNAGNAVVAELVKAAIDALA